MTRAPRRPRKRPVPWFWLGWTALAVLAVLAVVFIVIVRFTT